MRAEGLNRRRCGTKNKERAQKKDNVKYKETGDTWRLLVKLCQHIWVTGDTPKQMLLTSVVLAPKGTSTDFRGIGLLKVALKLLGRVLDSRLAEIELHDYLHGFLAKRECRTGMMETKLIKQLVFRE